MKRQLNSQLITVAWNASNGKITINTLNDKKRFTIKKMQDFDTLEQMFYMFDNIEAVETYSLAINNKETERYYFSVNVKNFTFLTKTNFQL
jgi:hypothetical protein